ncbi:MAG TPA: ethylbenzene dehydrogenase-related protein [bacterium]|nr:ethylbenzene dehydrogenase-related protein [bacterium]
MNRGMRIVLVLIAGLSLISGLLWTATRTSAQQLELVAVKVPAGPTLDGAVDPVWSRAKEIAIPVSGGANLPGGQTTVRMRALYTTDTVYFLFTWRDPTESLRRAPFQKQPDGSWKKLTDPHDKGGDNNLYYEDKLALIWNMSIKGFEQMGCFTACHAGEPGKPYGNKYTATASEMADMWHWKGVRTGPLGQVDDQYLDSTRFDPQTAPEAGRKSDPRTGGGYADNPLEGGKPKWALPNNRPAPPYWIIDSQKVAFDDTKYKPGDEVPGIVIAPFTGDRGDIASRAVHQDGLWVLEIARKLVTGSRFDIQFSNLNRPYYFGVAVFDNAQVRHAFQMGAVRFVFAP